MDAKWPAVPSLTTSFSHLSDRGAGSAQWQEAVSYHWHTVGFSGNDF